MGLWFLGCPLGNWNPASTLRRLVLCCPELVMLFVMTLWSLDVLEEGVTGIALVQGRVIRGKQRVSERHSCFCWSTKTGAAPSTVKA